MSLSEVENSLAVTLATTPSAIERGTLNEQSFPSTLNYGVPVQLLSRRPDVRAAEKTQILMTHSSTSYLDVLTAQQSLLSAQMDEAADRFASISAVITLYHALGGGAN